MGRPPCCDKVGIKKGPWTPEEDIILVSYIQEHGPGNWRSVPTNTEVKEENIDISKDINESLIIEEELEIKIVEEIDENPMIEKYLEVEMAKTTEDEIEEESFKDLDEVKLDDCNIQAPIILVGDTETNFTDFIGVERFDLIIGSYLVNIVN
ncbi:uncharacterized protein LOC136070324 [Quercus suber]|uniref:uncharacterized protein LOC136070324 n=1 Tax=Quercus suber TaxID=58331 RepID=UPI0032E00FD4